MNTKEIKLIALNIANRTNNIINNDDNKYWDRYNYNFEKKFSYLVKYGQFSLPTRERHIPLQKRYIDLLVAKKMQRPLKYSIFIDSKDVIEEKMDNYIRSFIEYAISRTKLDYHNLNKQKKNIDDQINQITSYVQSEEVNPEQKEELLNSLPDLLFYQRLMSDEAILTENIVKDFDYQKYMSSTEILEKIATKFLINLEKKHNTRSIFIKQFKDKLITGKQAFIVAKFGENSEPIIRDINSSNVVYDSDGYENLINKKDWVYYKEKGSYGFILENFGEQLKEDYGNEVISDLASLYSNSSTNNDMYALPDGGVVFSNDLIKTKYDVGTGIDIKWVWFRNSIPIYQKITNDKNGITHKHIIKNKKILKKDDYYYSDGFYINRKNKNEKFSKDESALVSKDEKINKKNLKTLYHAVIIDDKYVVNAAKWENIVRDEDNYNRFNLPIFGPAFDGIRNQPYSLIKATDDIQDLIDILNISREYMVAVSGTKTNVMDISQKPTNMSQTEWEMNIKMGRIYIQTMDENGNPKRGISFNQWQSFDNSISASVQYYGQIIDSLNLLMGSIIGISYQALGEVAPTDQVWTSQNAVQQSALITEVYFYESAQIEKEVLEEYLNLKIQSLKGEDIIFSDDNIKTSKQYILKTKNIKNRLGLKLYSYGEDAQKIQEIKQIAIQMKESLGISFSDVIRIWNSDTLKEMEAKLEYFEQQSMVIAQEQSKAQQESSIQLFKMQEQFKAEMEAYVEEVKSKYAVAKMKIDEAKLQYQVQKDKIDQELKSLEIGLKREDLRIKEAAVKEDTAVEKSMLILDDKHRTIDEQIRLLQLRVDSKLGDIKNKVDMKKAEKINSSKKHINDN